MAVGDKKRVLMEADINAAGGVSPAGYGYDGANSAVLGIHQLAGDTIEEKLTSLFHSMANNAAVQIGMTDTTGLNGFQYYGTFYKLSDYGDGFATVVLHGYDTYSRPVSVRRSMVYGIWQPYEWDNPPQYLGVEYRTTERYKGKPVYVKTFGINAVPRSAETVVEHNIANIAGVIENQIHDYNYDHCYTTHSGIDHLSSDSTTFSVKTNENWFSYSISAVGLMKYTKNTD